MRSLSRDGSDDLLVSIGQIDERKTIVKGGFDPDCRTKNGWEERVMKERPLVRTVSERGLSRIYRFSPKSRGDILSFFGEVRSSEKHWRSLSGYCLWFIFLKFLLNNSYGIHLHVLAVFHRGVFFQVK
jgi:hypothetical protein